MQTNTHNIFGKPVTYTKYIDFLCLSDLAPAGRRARSPAEQWQAEFPIIIEC